MESFFDFLKPLSNSRLFDLLREVEEQFEFCYRKEAKSPSVMLMRAAALPNSSRERRGLEGPNGGIES